MRRRKLSLLQCVLLSALVSCTGGGGTEPIVPPIVPVASIEVSPASASLMIGQSTALSASAKDAAGNALSGRTMTWSSANSGISSVNASGVLAGLAVGTTTISVSSEGRSATATVTVLPVPVATVVVTPGSGTLQLGQALQLTATTNDASGTALPGRTITWSSSSTAVATVSPAGLVSTVAPGSAIITATSEGKTATAAITVIPVPVAAVVVTPATSRVQLGQGVQLSASANDANGAALPGRAITWSSSDATVATVSTTGLVSTLAVGSATIIAASEGKSATAAIAVVPVPVAAVVVTPAASRLELGQGVALVASTNDANGIALPGRTVAWSSSDAAVATVSAAGVVSTLSVGSTTITATSEGRSGSASITVVPVPVASVSVTPRTATVQVGQSVQLAVALADANGNGLTGRTVTWTTNNSSIASVTSAGVATGAAPGSATITATSEGRAASATITVIPVPVATVAVAPGSGTLQPGQALQLTATTNDASGTALPGRTITWSSSSTAVATVSPAGLVSAVAPGSATITATSEGKTATAAITVIPVPVASIVVTPASVTLGPGQTSQLAATLRDAGGNLLGGRVVAWSSSDVSIATVSASGLVSAVASGTATVSASSEGVTSLATITVPPATIVAVTNELVDDIIVTANGVPLGPVPAGTTQRTTIYVTSLSLGYTLVRQLTPAGAPIGEPMQGVFPTVGSPSGNLNFVVNNQIGSQYYFAPLITNTSAYPLLMVANWGLAGENRCGCIVPASSTAVKIGYYKLSVDSDMRGYSPANGYGTGAFAWWNTFASAVPTGSGAVMLTNSSNIFDRLAAGALGVFAPSPAARQAARASVKGPVYDHAMPKR